MTGLTFFEAMRGDLFEADGTHHLIDFELHIEAATIGHLARTGEARLTGVVHALPWADHAAVAGTLTISPLRGRTLVYDVQFAGPDGRRYTVSGRKDVRVRHLLRSMTRMPTRLLCDGVTLATGEMRFDLNELIALVASMRPAQTVRHTSRTLPLVGAALAAPITDAEVTLVDAFCAALFEPGDNVPAPDAHTVARVVEQVAYLPPDVQLAWRAGLATLATAIRMRSGRPLHKLTVARRRTLLDGLVGPGAGKPLRRLADLVFMPMRVGHFGRQDYLDAVGYPRLINRVEPEEPRYMKQVTAAEDLPSDSVVEAEVVVVGTGAGGAAIAAQLAEQGIAVAIVEEGRFHGRQAFSGNPEDRMRALYRDRGLTFTVGSPPISVPLGKMVGGTTAVNSGTCLRVPADVLDAWRADLGAPTDFTADRFGRWYDKVESELQVAPNEHRYLGKIADVVARGAGSMGLDHRPLPRNAPGCDGQGVCIFGCPTAAKRSTNVSYIPRALKAGAVLYCGLPMRRILQRGRRAVGVEARGTDAFGAPKRLEIRADAVVIACGSLITPLILRDAGITSPWLGRNLSVHPGMGMLAMCDEPTRPWTAVPQGYGVHGAGDGITFEGAYMPPQFLVSTMPLFGAEMTRWMDRHDHVAQFGFMIRDAGDGWVTRGPTGRRLVRYELSDRSHARLQRGSAMLAEMLLLGGATEVLTGFGYRPIVRTVDEARRIGTDPLAKADFNLLGAHPLGTARMAGNAELGVVDPEHRVFGTANLYVVDGSAVPASLGVNPQITIMAMALRAGELLAGRLQNRSIAA